MPALILSLVLLWDIPSELPQVTGGSRLAGVSLTTTIVSPTANSTYDAGTASTVDLGGTALSDRPITGCTWTNSLGGSGAATGTITWTISALPLTVGSNVITVSCTNNEGTIAQDVITVSRAAASTCALSPGADTVFSVGSGKTFATLSACAAAITAGQTCDVYTGTYAGFTVAAGHDGTAGQPVTYSCHGGETCTLNSMITVTNRQYLLITGLHWSGSPLVFGRDNIGGGITTNHIDVCNNTAVGFTKPGLGLGAAISLYGDNNVIENNDLDGTGSPEADFVEAGGNQVVIRNNVLHDLTGTGGGSEHVDGTQVIGAGTVPTLTNSLIEGNTERNCLNNGANCHFIIIRTGGPTASNNIARFNFANNLNHSGVAQFGGIGDDVPGARLYHNTFTGGSLYNGNGCGASWQNASNGAAINNIFFDVCNMSGSAWSPVYDFSTGTGAMPLNTGNIGFRTGFSGSWGAAYAAEPTYLTLRNQNPNFSNLNVSCAINGGSPAEHTAQPLTTVAASDTGSGTSLVVADARVFWAGASGTQGDVIAINSIGNIAQVTAVNVSTNTVTLSTGLSRSAGQGIYLYKNSSGTIVWTGGAAPNIGACQ